MRLTVLLALWFALLAAGTTAAGGADDVRDELELAANLAFSIGTNIEIVGVDEIDPQPFNKTLTAAQNRHDSWATSFVQIGLRFAESPPQGRRQEISVVVPGEWEPGRRLKWARVTVFDGGWLDDSVAGQRYVIWIGSDASGLLVVRRAIYAQLCSRPNRAFWSSEPCP